MEGLLSTGPTPSSFVTLMIPPPPRDPETMWNEKICPTSAGASSHVPSKYMFEGK